MHTQHARTHGFLRTIHGRSRGGCRPPSPRLPDLLVCVRTSAPDCVCWCGKAEVIAADKLVLQSYGRPYSQQGKPAGTFYKHARSEATPTWA